MKRDDPFDTDWDRFAAGEYARLATEEDAAQEESAYEDEALEDARARDDAQQRSSEAPF